MERYVFLKLLKQSLKDEEVLEGFHYCALPKIKRYKHNRILSKQINLKLIEDVSIGRAITIYFKYSNIKWEQVEHSSKSHWFSIFVRFICLPRDTSDLESVLSSRIWKLLMREDWKYYFISMGLRNSLYPNNNIEYRKYIDIFKKYEYQYYIKFVFILLHIFNDTLKDDDNSQEEKKEILQNILNSILYMEPQLIDEKWLKYSTDFVRDFFYDEQFDILKTFLSKLRKAIKEKYIVDKGLSVACQKYIKDLIRRRELLNNQARRTTSCRRAGKSSLT